MIPWLLAVALAGAPCGDAYVVRTGDTVMCDGALVPTDDVRWLLRLEGEVNACGIERDGCKLQSVLLEAAHEEEVAAYEKMLAQRADRPFSWSTLAVGLAVGLVAGAAVTYMVVK